MEFGVSERRVHTSQMKYSSKVVMLQGVEGVEGIEGAKGMAGVEGVEGIEGLEGIEGDGLEDGNATPKDLSTWK